jgi:hypothetical protein
LRAAVQGQTARKPRENRRNVVKSACCRARQASEPSGASPATWLALPILMRI